MFIWSSRHPEPYDDDNNYSHASVKLKPKLSVLSVFMDDNADTFRVREGLDRYRLRSTQSPCNLCSVSVMGCFTKGKGIRVRLNYYSVLCMIDGCFVDLKISQSLYRPNTTTLFVIFTNVYQ